MKRIIQEEWLEQQSLKTFTEQAYLDYSMFVILDRALPHIGDGLKPVQRRIVYAMSELGLHGLAKFKKSARTIGDVLGKYHPHGEVACYEAMVMMAQSFSYRYPLVDGQGNWGAQDDPKSFAAMRYTEARLSRYAEVLLAELGQGTIAWIPNFDGSLQEPKILPARLPNVLLNGATGIAVGMATDIPPHNLREVANACIYLLDNPKSSVEELCHYIQGPDFATEAEIVTPKEELLKIYQTGNGTLRVRAVYTVEDHNIIITALPHLVSGSKVLEQIAQLMQAKKLPMISDLRDESDHENPTRIVIVPRSNRIDLEEVMSHLFATTSLENTYRVNLNLIGLDGRPKVLDLKTLLSQWLVFRTDVVRKRLLYRLEKVNGRLHILDGMRIAYLNLDKVIHIIRTEDQPKPVLQKTFGLTDQQAEAILELKLRHLAKLEEMKINQEQTALNAEKQDLEKHLSSDARLKTLIKKEIEKDAKQYGDARRSPIVARKEAQVMSILERIPSEPVTIILSTKGWVRAAKGYEINPESLTYKAGDSYLTSVQGKTDQNVVFMDSTGRAYTLAAHSLPSARSQGEPLTGRIDLPTGATIQTVLTGQVNDRYLMLSRAGYGFIVSFDQLLGKNRKGKTVIKVPESSSIVAPIVITDTYTHIAVLTSEGMLLIVAISEVPEMTQGKGTKLITITKEKRSNAEGIILAVGLAKAQSLICIAGKKKCVLSPKEWKTYIAEVGSKGKKLPKEFLKTQKLVVE